MPARPGSLLRESGNRQVPSSDVRNTHAACVILNYQPWALTIAMSKRINIILPDKTVAVLNRVASKGTRSRFIDRAVRHYVETQGRSSLREQLKTGYRANAERDLATAAEWFPLEEEVWRTVEASSNPKKSAKTRKP